MLTKFRFRCFIDCEEGKIAQVETTGDMEVPMNILCDENTDFSLAGGDLCEIDVCGVANGVELFKNEDEYYATGSMFAVPSIIPSGSFPSDGNAESGPGQVPVIMFTGTIRAVEKNPEPKPDEPGYRLEVETLEMSMSLYLNYDGELKEGSVISGEAWLFGDVVRAHSL